MSTIPDFTDEELIEIRQALIDSKVKLEHNIRIYSFYTPNGLKRVKDQIEIIMSAYDKVRRLR